MTDETTPGDDVELETIEFTAPAIFSPEFLKWLAEYIEQVRVTLEAFSIALGNALLPIVQSWGDILGQHSKMLARRQPRSWRKHVRMMKAKERRLNERRP